MKRVGLICTLVLIPCSLFGASVRGVLFQDQGVNKLKSFENGIEVVREIVIDKKFKHTLDSKMVNSPNYTLEFDGEIKNGKIFASKTPTIFGDRKDVAGFLTQDGQGNFLLDEQIAVFGRTKAIYGIPFDEESKSHYVGKPVNTQGHYEVRDGQKVFVINAILEKDLFSISKENTYQPVQEFKDSPKKYVLEELVKNENSQKRIPWRGVIAQDKKVKVGDNAVIITLSGRQGDAPGASAGHFAIGMGKVQKDLTLKGETFNFYFEGPKEVLAGNTDLISYFGHLIQGQQNYRPTYTVIAYGLKEEDLMKVRDEMETELHKVRTKKGLLITPGYNCTTTSNYALREIGIYGNQHNLGNRMLDVQNLGYLNPLSWWSANSDGEGLTGKARVLSYISTRDKEHYLPRNAFEAFVKNFSNSRWRRRKGIKRVDYVFIPQTPSARQVGGSSYNEIGEASKIQAFSKARDLRIADEKKAAAILEKASLHSDEELNWANAVSSKTLSYEEDQRQVKEVLENNID